MNESFRSLQKHMPTTIFTLVTLLTALAFSSKLKIQNFEGLAYTAKEVPVQLRISLNLILILVAVATYRIIKTNWLNKTYATNLAGQLSSIIILSLICFIPALNFGPSFFRIMSSAYKAIGIGHIGAGFADLAGVIQGSALAKFPGDYFKIDCPGTCVQYRWQYPSFFLELPWNSFLAQHVQLIAIILWILIVVVSIANLGQGFFKNMYFIFLCLPASLLSHERMNIEVLLFLLIPVLAKFHNKSYGYIIIPPLILMMVEIKFYPIVLVGLFVLLERFRLKPSAVYLLTGVLSVVLVLPDLRRIGGSNLVAGFAGSYGLQNFLAILEGAKNPYYQLVTVPYLLIGLLVVTLGIFYGTTVKLDSPISNLNFVFERDVFLITSALSCTAWVVNSNYMYRLVLLFWCLPFLQRIFPKNREVVTIVLTTMFLGMSIVHISLTPIRNILLTVSFAILLGIFLRTLHFFFIHDNSRSELNSKAD